MGDPFTDKPAGGFDIGDDLMDELFADECPEQPIVIRIESPDPKRILGNWKHLDRPYNGHPRSPRRQR